MRTWSLKQEVSVHMGAHAQYGCIFMDSDAS